jgi:TPR repeat protein
MQKAALQGHADAQGILGAMYASDRGAPQNHELARKWLGLASDQGIASAQFVYDLYFPDPVNGARLPPGVVPGIAKMMVKLAREEQSSPPHNRHGCREAQRHVRQRQARQR